MSEYLRGFPTIAPKALEYHSVEKVLMRLLSIDTSVLDADRELAEAAMSLLEKVRGKEIRLPYRIVEQGKKQIQSSGMGFQGKRLGRSWGYSWSEYTFGPLDLKPVVLGREKRKELIKKGNPLPVAQISLQEIFGGGSSATRFGKEDQSRQVRIVQLTCDKNGGIGVGRVTESRDDQPHRELKGSDKLFAIRGITRALKSVTQAEQD